MFTETIMERCIRALLTCLVLLGSGWTYASDDVQAQEQSVPAGGGFEIGNTGFRIGGYATGTYERRDDSPPRTAIENPSLFIWWDGEGGWKFFTEIEYENLLLTRIRSPDAKGYLSLERSYLEYAWSDAVSLRAGKFLTPIGRWNLVHATPLVWTTSRPMVTTLAFPTNMTGLMINGTLPAIGNGIEYSIYGVNGREIRPNPELDPFSSAVGAHVTWSIVPSAQLGLSYANFEQEKSRPERKQLTGVDFIWSQRGFELSAEAVYRFSDQGSFSDAKGAYVQLVAPLTDRWFAVLRYETYRAERESAPTQLKVTGLTFRITPTLVLKGEWVASKHNVVDAPDGLLTSISVLF
jgi:hypothetical protein